MSVFVERVVKSPTLVLGTYRLDYRPSWLATGYARAFVVIDLSRMPGMHVDPARRTARAEAEITM